MKLLLNSTKTMDLGVKPPKGLRTTKPRHHETAAELVTALRAMPSARYRKLLALSDRLLGPTRTGLAAWGAPDRPARPALFAFTGLVYKYLAPERLDPSALRDAQQRLLILSGLYGLLRPLDRIEQYRLEMGVKWAPDGGKSLAGYWREELTGAVNRVLRRGEPVIDLGAREYSAALDEPNLKGRLIHPVFKETRPGGSLKTVPVHAKMARGALARFILASGAANPADLLAFSDQGWEAADEPPESGSWLFTRPARD